MIFYFLFEFTDISNSLLFSILIIRYMHRCDLRPYWQAPLTPLPTSATNEKVIVSLYLKFVKENIHYQWRNQGRVGG